MMRSRCNRCKKSSCSAADDRHLHGRENTDERHEALTSSAMKQQILWFALCLLTASGCTRSYTCGCTDFDNGPFYYTIEAASEDAAREACESPGGDCTLQTD